MTNKIYAVIITALVLVGSYFLFGGNSPKGNSIVGSVTGPELLSDFWSVNGVTTFYERRTMNQATTTLCFIKSPSATTTLEQFTVKVAVGTTTAATIDVGTSLLGVQANATATALFIQSYAIASGAQGSVVLPGALPTTATSTILAPNTFVTAKTNEVGLAGFTYTGSCTAEFRSLN